MLRRVLTLALVTLFVAALVARRDELATLPRALAATGWAWLLPAGLAQVAATLCSAYLYRGALATCGVSCGLGQAWTLGLASLFVNLVAPSGGAAGAALWIDELGRRGASRPATTAGVVLAAACEFMALTLLASACVLAASRAAQGLAAWAAFGLLALCAGALAGVLFVALHRPSWVAGLLEQVRRVAARLAKARRAPEPLPPDWPERSARVLASAAALCAARPDRIAALIGIALAAHVSSAACLGILGHALRQPQPVSAVLSAYTLGLVAWIFSPVPQGVGVVEGVIAATYVALGVPPTSAVLLGVTYRALTLWLPMLVGFVLLRRLRTFRLRS